MSAMFRSLRTLNYRIWFAGAMVSNIGTWMQRTAQDWIVLTELTDHDATAVGITMALQFVPQLLLVPWSGLIADRFDKRRLLMVTQASMGALGLGLGLIVVTGVAQLWMVYVFAFLLGVAAAIDAPVRQIFVSELVEEKNLSNAVSLNSASFNIARMIGPAVAGVLVVAIGSGWVFLLNAASFAGVLTSLRFLKVDQLRRTPSRRREPGALLEGFRYVRNRPDLVVIFVVIFIIGTFGLNFAIFASTMATVEFGMGAGEFGLLSSVLAIGSVAGALLSARRERPRMRMIFFAAGGFGLAALLAAFMPTYLAFALVLPLIGFAAQTLLTSANGAVQLSTDPTMRGRVMALYMAIIMGGTPIGAPIVGWVADAFGPRWALGVGAAAGIVAALVGLVWMVRHQHLSVRYRLRGTPHLVVRHDGMRGAAQQATAAREAAARDAARTELGADETAARTAS